MTNAVATRAPDNTRALMAVPDEVEKALRKPERNAAIRALLGDAMPMDRFEQIVIQSIYRNPDIQKASLASLLDAVRVSATLKLEPTGILGEGYLIRYGNDAQFEAGYRGLMKLARRSGQVSAVDSQIVYVNDDFAIQQGSEPRIDHRPLLDGDRGAFRGAYAYARLSTGELITEWMRDADIQAVRKSSRNGTGTSSPWVNHFGEMARKTVLKRLMKRLPLGTDAEMALRVEAEADQAGLAPRPVRSSTVTAIHEKLGITPAPTDTVETDDVEWRDAPMDVTGGTPTPAEVVAAPEATPPASGAAAQCEGFDVTLGRCRKDAGHANNHQSAEGESWR